jgi:hypothetical protein
MTQRIWRALSMKRGYHRHPELSDQRSQGQLSVFQRSLQEGIYSWSVRTISYPNSGPPSHRSDLFLFYVFLATAYGFCHRMASRAAKAKATMYKEADNSEEDLDEMDSEQDST